MVLSPTPVNPPATGQTPTTRQWAFDALAQHDWRMAEAADPAPPPHPAPPLHTPHLLDAPAAHRFDRVIHLARRVFDTPIAYIALIDADRQWFKARCGLEPRQADQTHSFCGHTILHNNRPLIVPDTRLDPRFADNPLVHAHPAIRFYAGCPLRGPDGYNVATFCIADHRPRRLDAAQRDTLADLADLAEQQVQLADLVRTQHDLIATKNQLVAARARLDAELAQAARYVHDMLPAPLEGPVHAQYQFVSSSQLGGDLLGYHWLDDQQLAFYLLDVTGHGVAAAMLSISVGNALRRPGLLSAPLHQPGAVLHALNRAFPMHRHQNKFFTIWYGVLDTHTRALRYASAGHPPALLLDPRGRVAQRLGQPALMIGAQRQTRYDTHHAQLPPRHRLYLFSDGAYEVQSPRRRMLRPEGLQRILTHANRPRPHPAASPSRTERALRTIRRFHGRTRFDDDFSLLELELR